VSLDERIRDIGLRLTEARLRWTIYLVLTIFFVVFALFPKPYIALARVMPQDTSSAAGTANLLMSLGSSAANQGSVLSGGRASADVYLMLARSDLVSNDVIAHLHLLDKYPNAPAAKRALAKKVGVSMLLGGVMEVEAKTYDPADSVRLTTAYVDAMGRIMRSFGSQVFTNRIHIIEQRFPKASERVSQAEQALNVFRRQNNLPVPEQQLGLAFTMRAGLEAQLQSKQIELATLTEFNGPENPQVKAAQVEIAQLQQQIARAAAPSQGIAGPNLTRASVLETKYMNLYRDYRLAQGIYEIYAKQSEQIAVDRLSTETASYIQIVDAPYLDIYRHFNVWAVAGLSLVLLTMVFVEVYGPLSGLFNLRDLRRRHEAVD